jgi:hypothetical protein
MDSRRDTNLNIEPRPMEKDLELERNASNDEGTKHTMEIVEQKSKHKDWCLSNILLLSNSISSILNMLRWEIICRSTGSNSIRSGWMSFRTRVAKIRKICPRVTPHAALSSHVSREGSWARLGQRVDLVTLSLPPASHIDSAHYLQMFPVDSQTKLVAPKFASICQSTCLLSSIVILVVVTSC